MEADQTEQYLKCLTTGMSQADLIRPNRSPIGQTLPSPTSPKDPCTQTGETNRENGELRSTHMAECQEEEEMNGEGKGTGDAVGDDLEADETSPAEELYKIETEGMEEFNPKPIDG